MARRFFFAPFATTWRTLRSRAFNRKAREEIPQRTQRKPIPCVAAENPDLMNIHPTAIIDPGAKISSSCRIGPYCTVGPNVEMGEGCELISHVAVEGPTRIGAHNRFLPFSSIG